MASDDPIAALDDIRVLDLAGEMGQYCTKLLADLGADVIKVEPPSGDPVRHLPPFYERGQSGQAGLGHDEQDGQNSLYWLNLNTSKRSVTLDLESAEGRRLFERLAATADVVVETFEPGYLDGLGLGYEGLSRIKPDIVLTSITGFGQTGPHAHYKAPDIVGVAMGGVMWLAGDPQDPPNVPPWRQGYISASIIAAAGTLTALYHRDAHGEGQHVDVSMQEALSIAQETAMQTWDMLQQLRYRTGARGMLPIEIPGIGIYECRDGHVFGYVGTPGGAPWTELLDWMIEEGKAEDLGEEPYRGFIGTLNLRFLTGLFTEPAALGEKVRMLAHLNEVLRPFLRDKGKWEVYEVAQRRRLLFGIVSTPEDIANNPQLESLKWLTPVAHPELGETLTYPGPPYRLSETPWAIRRRPPQLGEHNAEVYGELGVDQGELERLRAAGVV
ncbi:MAG TPA: CoA transferase [Dehalococcoidia bacterium]|nr:CoA transferase [Dehalococcoidia bacterium]